MDKLNSVLVIGAGVGGMKASLDLAEAGFKVYLCDRSSAIGGTLIRVDKWFPDNHCGLCQMLPVFSADNSSRFCLRRGLTHPDIELMPLTEVKEVAGQAGDFRIGVTSRAAGVIPELCISCGLCTEVCPVETASEFNEGLSPRKAIYTVHPGILPYVYTVDWDSCTKCGACVAKCPTQAIRLREMEMIKQLRVGAVILATGFEKFDPALASQYGYQRYPNVLTGIELERIISPGGPTDGDLLRPSDNRTPKSIAFLQCVGSRDNRKDYCSSVCCMFALKEATLLKQANPEIDIHIFYMDIRAFGKDHYRYYQRARDELGIKFIRGRVPVIREDSPTKNLVLTTIEENEASIKRQFELVVLSVGQTPPPRFQELCQVLGVELNRWGFCRSGLFSPVNTTREGIYVCGSASAPKDIADTMVEAGAAADRASGWLERRMISTTLSEKTVESAAEKEETPRLSVLLCDCGQEISSVLDLEELAESSRQLPDITCVMRIPFLCDDDVWVKVDQELRKHKVNRLVIGACSHYFNIHLAKLGFNSSSAQIVNLREHIAWVHRDNRQAATDKAKNLLAMAVELVRALEPEPVPPMSIHPVALVIGGGLAGLMAALSLTHHGIEVHLVEKSAGLGGNLKQVYYALEGDDPQVFREDIINQVKTNRLIHVVLETELVKTEGYAGNFVVSLKANKSSLYFLEVGAIIVASGGEEYRPTEYLYGQNKNIVTQRELERKLFSAELDLKNMGSVVMIQCVGSREKERPYCSR
ncbi:MAG: FAD-dependent oxidoreductase, partial [Dehalococcoidales bacterium]|nr:FAD-dependent oxidoreductase [Dehalococcoidales bacterium]